MILPQVHLRKPCYDFYFLHRLASRVIRRRELCYPSLRIELQAGIEFHARLGSAAKLSFRFARRIDPMGFAGGDPE